MTVSATLTGDKELDYEIRRLFGDDEKSIKGGLRIGTRKACKEIILPHAQAHVPTKSGYLKSELRVKAAKFPRRSGKVGHYVGFTDRLFTGDTYYAGFLEFGTRERRTRGWKRWRRKPAKTVPTDNRGKVEPVRFLRNALYQNERAILVMNEEALRAWVKRANAKHARGRRSAMRKVFS